MNEFEQVSHERASQNRARRAFELINFVKKNKNKKTNRFT